MPLCYLQPARPLQVHVKARKPRAPFPKMPGKPLQSRGPATRRKLQLGAGWPWGHGDTAPRAPACPGLYLPLVPPPLWLQQGKPQEPGLSALPGPQGCWQQERSPQNPQIRRVSTGCCSWQQQGGIQHPPAMGERGSLGASTPRCDVLQAEGPPKALF